MKTVLKEKHILRTLQKSSCKLFKAIVKNCNDNVITVLAEILHNIVSGNCEIDTKTLNKLKRFKDEIKKTHDKIKKNKSINYRRKIFSNQTGGFWPILLETVLSTLAAYTANKLATTKKTDSNNNNGDKTGNE